MIRGENLRRKFNEDTRDRSDTVTITTRLVMMQYVCQRRLDPISLAGIEVIKALH